MQVKCLEVRDRDTFIPIICVRPIPENEAQRYLLRRDGYTGSNTEPCIILIDAQCCGVSYDPHDWQGRTLRAAHAYISDHWDTLKDGDVVDVEYISGESATKKISERVTAPI